MFGFGKNKLKFCECFDESARIKAFLLRSDCNCAWCSGVRKMGAGNDVNCGEFQAVALEAKRFKEENEWIKAEEDRGDLFFAKLEKMYVEEIEQLKADNQLLKADHTSHFYSPSCHCNKCNYETVGRENARLKQSVKDLKLMREQTQRTLAAAIDLKNKYKRELEALRQNKVDDFSKCPDVLAWAEQNTQNAEQHIKFKVGDRVAVTDKNIKFRGTIISIANNKISVTEDGLISPHDCSPYLPSQCKKLCKVKRKKYNCDYCKDYKLVDGKPFEMLGKKFRLPTLCPYCCKDDK